MPYDAESLDTEGSSSSDVELAVRTSAAMLEVKQLETIGNHFLEVLLKMKHNGAIDKTRAGFTALCNRLLCSNDPRYVSILFSSYGFFYFYYYIFFFVLSMDKI